MPKYNNESLEFLAETRAQWRAWLIENHLSAKGVWLYFYKKNSDKPVLPYAEAVEEALCFGWIDSKPGTVDDIKSKLYYSPRNPKSNWSALNKTRVEKLTAQGLIYPEGQRMIDFAKQTGTWDALNDVDKLLIPNDLQEALVTLPNATKYFDVFPRSVKRGILEWIMNAKTIETRQKRIIETATLAEQNIRANQYVKKQYKFSPFFLFPIYLFISSAAGLLQNQTIMYFFSCFLKTEICFK